MSLFLVSNPSHSGVSVRPVVDVRECKKPATQKPCMPATRVEPGLSAGILTQMQWCGGKRRTEVRAEWGMEWKGRRGRGRVMERKQKKEGVKRGKNKNTFVWKWYARLRLEWEKEDERERKLFGGDKG